MEHTNDGFPYNYEDIPNLKQLLATVDWDVACVYDACRWDAFEVVCEESEPVASPDKDTPKWTQRVWCDPEMDWADVTYISANPATEGIRHREKYGGVVENHVKEFVNIMDVYDRDERSVHATEAVLEAAEEYEPPMVLHFLPPHTPYVGNVGYKTLNVDERGHAYEDVLGVELGQKTSYELARDGHISKEFARLSYLKNLEYVWWVTKPIRDQYEKVVTTGDHGEILGPDKWGHTDSQDNRNRVVPFHTTWEIEFPAPIEVGASETHEWVTTNTADTTQSPNVTEDEATSGSDADSQLDSPSEDIQDNDPDEASGMTEKMKEQLRALGYRKFP